MENRKIAVWYDEDNNTIHVRWKDGSGYYSSTGDDRVLKRVSKDGRESLGVMISANGGGYRMAKGMMDIVGHPTGPPRLPTEPLNDEELTALRAAMEKLGWA